MGRDVTGVRGEMTTSPHAKVRPKIAADTNQEASNPSSPEQSKEVKDCEVKECTSEIPRAENTPLNQHGFAVRGSSSEKPEAENSKVIKNTSTKPSDVTVDKQVCSPDSSGKKSQPSTPQMTRKLLDEDDAWSMTSSASVRTTRSRTTVPVAPTFSISDRLQKRKEYYAKLEEKRKALEAEKREYEARTKEEEEAAIKQLRKNLKFKANPVPNFYYEKPPPKKEFTKLPTTRAVSPKFSRRKSFNDAVVKEENKVILGRSFRHSLGSQSQSQSQRERSTPPTSTTKRKESVLGGVGATSSKPKDRLLKPPPVKETLKQTTGPTTTTTTTTTSTNPDIIAVHS